jgi:hypothetical protein
MSFGVGLAAAIAVDIALDRLVKAAGHDPQAQVTESLASTLDRVRGLLADGDAQSREDLRRLREISQRDPDAGVRAAAAESAERLAGNSCTAGLRGQLQQLAGEHMRLTEQALRELILEGRP